MSLDILHHEAQPRPHSRRVTEVLTFGFARGVEEDALLAAVALPVTETNFRRDCFAADLFIDEFIEGCLPVDAEGRRYEPDRPRLKRLLLSPPRRQADTLFRQGIFKELREVPALKSAVECAYGCLRALRTSLVGLQSALGRTGAVQRRIDILVELRRAILSLREGFGSCHSGLSRIGVWAREIEESDEYRRLDRLLAFEDQRAVLESRLQVGYDGSLRRFEIVGVAETQHAGFSRGALRRFFRRVLNLFKGYRFSEEDVMSQLLDQIYSDLEWVVVESLSLAASLEFYLAGLGFAALAERNGQHVSLPSFAASDAEEGRLLEGLFNPWLLLQAQPAVSCSLHQEPARATLIVTGPNSGGKTRLLQAIAMTQLLGQVGMFVPASKARLLWVDQLFLSLLERVEADQKEGRLGMELMRIRRVFETSAGASLIVMDELCSGTNPSEGEQIFEMVLGLLEELRPQVVISTHFLDFAKRIQSRHMPHVQFLQVQLGARDVPTYQFVEGVASTSLARNTAARLGVTREELLSLVETHRQARRVGSRAD